MDGLTPRPTDERPSHWRGALVAFAIVIDLAWVAIHVPALALVGLVEGDPRFYAAYQFGRCAVTAGALVVALRGGLFSRRELGLTSARHVAALCWLAKLVALVALGALAVLSALVLVAPAATCDLARRSLALGIVLPWDMFRVLVCMAFIAPVYEELLYRSLLLSVLRDRLSEQAALVAGGGVFVVLHYAYGYGWRVGYMAAGLVYGLAFLRSGSIVPAIVLHVINNLWFALGSYARDAGLDAALVADLCRP
jgi:hypothetical protein